MHIKLRVLTPSLVEIISLSNFLKGTGMNCFWIIDNSQQVLSPLKQIISLQLSVLIVMISLHYIQAFTMLRIYFVADSNGTTYWSEVVSTSSTKCNINEKTLIVYMEYLIDNIYVSIGNKAYRQCVRIPMGTDCAPLVANIFLSYYEYNYMRNLI